MSRHKVFLRIRDIYCIAIKRWFILAFMERVRFNTKAIENAQARIAQALARPKAERRSLTQAERDSLIQLTPIQQVFNDQKIDHVAE